MPPRPDPERGLRIYERDWPYRFAAYLAALVEHPFRSGEAGAKPPSAWTVGLLVFIVADIVAVMGAALGRTIWGGVDIPLSRDYVAFYDFVFWPLSAGIVFSLYARVYPIFDQLYAEKVIGPEDDTSYASFKAGLNRRLNSVWPQALFLAIVVVHAFFWLPSIGQIGQTVWIDKFPLGIKVWLVAWLEASVFSLQYFAYRALVLISAIGRLCHQQGLEIHIQDYHPDGCGGLKRLSNLWLSVHYMVVATGIWIFSYAVFWAQWTNPILVFGAVVYGLLAPALFIGPFWPIHKVMVKNRDEKVAGAARRLQEATTVIAEQSAVLSPADERLTRLLQHAVYCRESYGMARSLPTWPFTLGIGGKFVATYVIPFVLFAVEFALRLPAVRE
ncbi:MAG: hypothetical protein HYX91_03645 [Chloroflexi bacterium]|nr:hypothetical protein [Chloroflexota bacterium]